MRGSKIEAELKKYVEDKGGIFYKFTSPKRKNVPDRLVVLPKCMPFFMEIKGEGDVLSSGQRREIQYLQERGQIVFITEAVPQGKMQIDGMWKLRDKFLSMSSHTGV